MTNPVTHRVRVEPKRVQTFLFEVPRLRAMVGANVLLGEFLRFELADAYLQIEAPPPGPEPSDGAAMDSTVDVLDCAIANWGASLQADMRKRYFKHGGREELLLSDKPHDLRALGIFSREGGHFHALFTSLDNVVTR